MEWSDIDVGSELEINFGEEEMLWSCLQYCPGDNDYDQQQHIDILQLEPFLGVFPV